MDYMVIDDGLVIIVGVVFGYSDLMLYLLC